MIKEPPLQQEIVNKTKYANDPWASFFSSVYRQSVKSELALEGTGTTSNRPTDNLWVGRTYLDTTLGKPIWVESLSPTVWIDATGATV